MADRLARGFIVEESPGRETALDAFPAGVTAFVGAAARGPVNEVIAVDNAAEFERQFGIPGVELPLQHCVHDYFLAGGTRAAVVRVANGARPCTLRLPAMQSELLLEALSPGRREYLRASVDYDNIAPSEEHLFNLVVQRLRAPGTERVAEQEVYSRLSARPDAERYIGDALLESRLVRIRAAAPGRPDVTVSSAPGYPVSWVEAADDGDDGAALSDYDLVGSSVQGSGLFALRGVGPLDFVSLPPGADGRVPGPTLLLAALRYCRKRGAMLLLEPPPEARDAEQALGWLAELNVAGENAIAVFPPLAGDTSSHGRPAAGAIAGALCRDPTRLAPVLGGQFRPLVDLSQESRRKLIAAGINVLGRGANGKIVLEGDRTLASPECPVQAWRSLAARRLALAVERTLLQGTRWVVFEPPGPDLAQRLRDQLGLWLESLRFAGRLAGEAADAWFVDVHEVSAANQPARVEFTVGFAPRRPKDFVIYRVSQGLHGARIAPVSAERWAITQPLEESGPGPDSRLEVG
jgi:uncharacterized protein